MARGSQPPPGAGRLPDGPDDAWFRTALEESGDLVLLLRSDTTIVWCNPGAHRLGYDPDGLIGRSFAEFVHPDDLERAAEVIVLEQAGVFDRSNPMTAALYRVRHADGTWHALEVNASTAPDDDLFLVIARPGGDLVVYDRLLESVTGGEPFENQVELVVDLARWRHPTEGYAVCYLDQDGDRRWHAVNLPPTLHDVEPEGEVTPWTSDIGSDPEVALLGPVLRAAADEGGFIDCLVAGVDDPAHPEGARLMIWTTSGGPTASGHRYAMDNMRRALALVLQQRAQLDLLERAVRTDPLTGVTSRARLMELLDEADSRAAGDCHAVLYVDLDGFKEVNDSLGHMRGDHVLREAAHRLSAAVPTEAVLARLGGDEFVVLCPPGTGSDAASDLAQGIVDRFTAPLSVDAGDQGAWSVSVGVSVGVAVGDPGTPVSATLDAADQALYRAKELGRGRWAS